MNFVCVGTNNGDGGGSQPVLQFHNTRGEHVRLSPDRCLARRVDSFCKGIAFSQRTVRPNEKVRRQCCCVIALLECDSKKDIFSYFLMNRFIYAWRNLPHLGMGSSGSASLQSIRPHSAESCPNTLAQVKIKSLDLLERKEFPFRVECT